MTLDGIRIGPRISVEHEANKFSFVALCSTFRSALHLAMHFHRDLPAADVDNLKSGLLLFQERWAIGGTSHIF